MTRGLLTWGNGEGSVGLRRGDWADTVFLHESYNLLWNLCQDVFGKTCLTELLVATTDTADVISEGHELQTDKMRRCLFIKLFSKSFILSKADVLSCEPSQFFYRH